MRTAVRRARRTLERVGRDRFAMPRMRLREILGVPPTEPLSRILFEFARSRPDAFVVQIGAHDASQMDPIRRYILKRRWRGILVEPVPHVFERLVSNYSDVDGLVFENVAIGPHDGTMELYYIPPTSQMGLPPWYDALASFNRDVLLSHQRLIPDISDRIASITVPTVTFDTLCLRHAVERIDLVQIDAEGYDHEIIKLIDLPRFRPAMLHFEELHMDEATRQDCLQALVSHGYEAIGNTMDCLCLNPSWLRPGEERLLREWRRLRGRGDGSVFRA